MSASAKPWPLREDEPETGLVPFPTREAAGAPGEWLAVAAAAAMLGVSISTLRRALKRAAAEAPPGAGHFEGDYRGHWFAARRVNHGRRPSWEVRLIQRPIDAIPVEAVERALRRVADFREEQAREWQEHPLEHTSTRRHWWQVWRPA